MSRNIIQTKVRLKRPFLCFLFIVNGLWLQGQQYRYDYTWLMSDYTRNIMVMTFHKPVDSNNVRIDSVKKELRLNSSAMISNSAGELVAYSNGCFINHRGYDVMENGGGINPGNIRMESCTTDYNYYPTAEQSMVFIPDPMDVMRYYLIHNSAVIQYNPLKAWTDALRYSIIDMRYNNGKGKVVEKNKILLGDSTLSGEVAVMKHANNKSYWVVTKKALENSYYSFVLNDTGITGPYIQKGVGDTSAIVDFPNATCLFSPNDGKKFIRYSAYQDGFNIFDFDRSTGQLSNYRRIPVTDSLVLDGGACFSPSGRFLYVGTYWDLYQYDLESTDIKGSEVHIAHYDGYRSKGVFRAMIGRMQWGPDCKIYVNCRSSMDALHVIHRPNEKGIACDFRPHDLKLPQLHGGTLPYFPNYRLGLAPLCDPELTVSVSEVPVLPEVYVFPNPSRDRIHISVREGSSNAGRLQIYNTAGQRIKESAMVSGMNEYEIEVSGWQSGIYFYVIYLNDGRMMNGKFVVE
ncbi:MAG: T9SS type A sorting domain-containing protein [Saprospiraceae bacterium]|nr:T9SS type A sorting domain-containing protein [Candidatus Vicinibacter affinis]